mgnify:CR=1 FL=1
MEKLTDESLMPYGPHQGKPMKDVPAKYLIWCWEKYGEWSFPEVKVYIEENLEALQNKVKK